MNPLVYIRLALVALVFSAFAGLGYMGYNKIQDIQYQKDLIEFNTKIKEYEDNVNKRIATIENNSSILVSESRENNLVLADGIQSILKGTKGKALVIVKNGDCTPSQTFSDTFNSVNRTVNQNMKGK